MDKAFRNHPALGAMIQRTGDGKYKLAASTAGKARPARRTKRT